MTNTPKAVARLLMSENSGAIAASIIRTTEHSNYKSLLVTSCHDGEGKTLAAVNMAYALASEAHRRVLLVDCNPIAPKLHELFEIPAEPGFVDLLRGEVQASQAVRASGIDGLSVLPLGSRAAGWLDWARPQKLQAAFEIMSSYFDVLVFDGPSVFGPVDTAVFAKAFDGVLMVIECERTRWEVVQSANDRLGQSGANVLGAVMNKRRYYIPQGLYEQ